MIERIVRTLHLCSRGRNPFSVNNRQLSDGTVLKEIPSSPSIITGDDSSKYHKSVMKNEIAEYLDLQDEHTLLDMTFGAGGHSRFMLEKFPNLRVIALDRDPLAHQFAKKLQNEFPKGQIIPLLGKFSDLRVLAEDAGISPESVDGAIMDLGASSMQMDTPERGFAISNIGPLDMRMDGDRCEDSITAADVVNYASETSLYKIFKIYGEEKKARAVARAISQARITYQKFTTTKDLVDLVSLIIPGVRHDKLLRPAHSATKIFQALRIFVNNELNEISSGLANCHYFLKNGGRIVVLTFHSLEDTVVKCHFLGHDLKNAKKHESQRFRDPEADVESLVKVHRIKFWSPINKKVHLPTKEEVESNPRSRSAKLRAAVKNNINSV